MSRVERDRVPSPSPDERYEHPDPIMDAALDWFLRLQQVPDDVATQAGLRRWLELDPRHAVALAEVERLWRLPELGSASRRHAARLDAQAATDGARTPPHPRRWWLSAAAAAAAMALVALGLDSYPTLKLRLTSDHMTAVGERDEVILPDGSRMTLNTASAVSLDFAGGRRSVHLLAGEAYFDVVHDPRHPFTVSARFGEVEVRGTAFSVRAGPVEDTVVLERGSIEVHRLSDPQDRTVLAPGERITVSASAVSRARKTDTATALAWRDGWIIFQERPFAAVLDDLRRYYGGPVVTIDDRIGRVLVSGNYRLANPEGVIRSLAQAAGADVTRLPGGILILR